MLGMFTPGEKVKIGQRYALIVRRHQWKRTVWYVNVPDSGYGWFDETFITKIEPVMARIKSGKKLAHERNANNRHKHFKKGTGKDFLMLSDI